MEEAKSFLLSRTMWGLFLALVGAGMDRLGFETSSLNGLDGDIVSLLGIAFAAYGRFKAVKKLK